MVEGEHNTVTNVLGSFFRAGGPCSLPFLPRELFTWRFAPVAWTPRKAAFRPTMPRDLTSETEPPYMVLQPLSATYTDTSRGFTQGFFPPHAVFTAFTHANKRKTTPHLSLVLEKRRPRMRTAVCSQCSFSIWRQWWDTFQCLLLFLTWPKK